jgi:Transposase IS116/IS110/IS902 family
MATFYILSWRNIPITLTIRVLSVIAYFNYLGSNGHKKKKGHSAIQACSQTRYSRPASPSISSCVWLRVASPSDNKRATTYLVESHRHPAVKLLCQIPAIGPIRSALLVALLQTPHRFRTKRQLWAYSGFALETRDSGEYRMVRGKVRRNRERLTVLGLNDNHNHDLKNLFKGAAISAITCPGPLYDFYAGLLAKGMRPTMARLTLARKIATITLTMWKRGVDFDANELQRQAA